MKLWLEKNDIEMYSTHNEGKSVVPERFIRTLKNKIWKYKNSVSKNVYTDKLYDIVNKCNNTCHSTIKMKPFDVKSNRYIDSSKEISDKNPKFKIGDNVRISKLLQIGLKMCLWLKKLKILCRGHTLLMILFEKKLMERSTKTNCKKQIKKSLELKI